MMRTSPAKPSSEVNDKVSAGDPIPPKCAVIEVHVGELKQLFNSIDPSPFHNKDLDPDAEEFIVGWAKDLPHDASLGLVVELDRPAGLPDEAAVLREAIHEFFRQRAETQRRSLRELLRRGRTSLLIGLTVLAAAIALGDFLANLLKTSRIGEIVRESLTIGGWVSMWRPLEVFLYDWWPIRNEARLSDRLAAMPVRIRYMNATSPDAWTCGRAGYPAGAWSSVEFAVRSSTRVGLEHFGNRRSGERSKFGRDQRGSSAASGAIKWLSVCRVSAALVSAGACAHFRRPFRADSAQPINPPAPSSRSLSRHPYLERTA